MDFKYRIEQAQAKLKDAEQAKTVAETQLKTAKDECDAVIKETLIKIKEEQRAMRKKSSAK